MKFIIIKNIYKVNKVNLLRRMHIETFKIMFNLDFNNVLYVFLIICKIFFNQFVKITIY